MSPSVRRAAALLVTLAALALLAVRVQWELPGGCGA